MKTNENFSVTFFAKKTKPLKDGTLPIFVRISYNGERIEFSTQKSVSKTQWNSKRTEARGASLESKKINNQLLKIREKLTSIYEKMYINEERITLNIIKDSYLGLNSDKKYIIKMYDSFINDIKARIGNGYKHSTCVRHLISKNILSEFIKSAYRKDDLNIEDVDYAFVTKLEEFMITVKKHNPNTRGKHLKNVKIIIIKALKCGLIKTDPFYNIKIPSNHVNKIPLSMDEVLKIQNKVFENKRIDAVRDAFIFCCYTGLSYIDLCSLRHENIKKHNDNRTYIEIYRQKSSTPCYIPILKPVEKLIEKYKEHPLVKLKQTLIPVYTNQRLNVYLKEIADVCDIQKPITTHIGRYTFNTTIAMEQNISSDVRQKIVGHSTARMNEHYSKVSIDYCQVSQGCL
jgi:integrase